MEKNNIRQNATLFKLLLVGIFAMCIGFHQLPTWLTFKSSLIPVKGTLRNANTYTETFYYKGRETRKAELIFYFKGKEQQYYLTENIGDEYIDEKYEEILRGLKRAKSITVWIKKNATSQFKPQVFQIDADTTTLLEHETVRTKNGFIIALFLILGPGCILVFLALKFPRKFAWIFGAKTKDT